MRMLMQFKKDDIVRHLGLLDLQRTMQRALAELERRGLVFSERTSGRFVTKDNEILMKLHEELAKRCFDEFAEKLRRIGMSADEIKKSVSDWIGEIK